MHHGATYAAFNRRKGNSKPFGDLAVRKPAEESELDGFTHLRWERSERLPDSLCVLRLLGVVRGLGDRGQVTFCFCLRSFVKAQASCRSAEPVNRLVPSDRDGPGQRGAATRVVVGGIPPDFCEDLLQEFFCILGTIQHAQRERIENPRKGVIDPLECDGIAFRHAPYYGGAHFLLAFERLYLPLQSSATASPLSLPHTEVS